MYDCRIIFPRAGRAEVSHYLGGTGTSILKDGDDDDFNDDNSDIKPRCPITSEEQTFNLERWG